jgi:hypothetical protein
LEINISGLCKKRILTSVNARQIACAREEDIILILFVTLHLIDLFLNRNKLGEKETQHRM